MMRMHVECDAPACAVSIETDRFRWGRGLDPFLLALVEARWIVDGEGRLFCPAHAEAARLGPLPQTSPVGAIAPPIWETHPLFRRWAAQSAEWQAIRDELVDAAQGERGLPFAALSVTAHQVTLEQRKRALARGEPLVTYEELEAAARGLETGP